MCRARAHCLSESVCLCARMLVRVGWGQEDTYQQSTSERGSDTLRHTDDSA